MRPPLAVVSCTLLSLSLPAAVASQAPRWEGREILRLGGVDGPAALAGVFDGEFARDGRILVAQTNAGLAEFGPNGRYLRTVGRKGPGPGEFTFMSRLGWKADTLWAVDMNRLNLFDSDLRFVRTVTPQLEAPPPGMRVNPGPLMADGSVIFVAVGGNDGPDPPVILASEEGRRIRVLARGTDRPRQTTVNAPTGLAIWTPDPWPSHTLWLHDTDGRSIILVDRRDEENPDEPVYRIMRIALNGDTVTNAAIRYTPRPIGRDLSDAFFRQRAEWMASRPGDLTVASAERLLRGAMTIPRHAPPVTKVVPASDGTTWVRREDLRDATVEWQVLDREFDEVARLTLPADLEVFRVTADRILGRVTDDLDVPWVVVYEILKL
jgi:hypothetical protein